MKHATSQKIRTVVRPAVLLGVVLVLSLAAVGIYRFRRPAPVTTTPTADCTMRTLAVVSPNLPDAVQRASFAERVRGCPARRVKREGTVALIRAESLDGKTAEQVFLQTDEGARALFFDGDPPPALRSGDRVSVDGLEAGELLQVAVGDANEDSQQTGLTILEASPTAVTGEQRTLVLLAYTQGMTMPARPSPGEVKTVLDGPVNIYTRENSYNQAWLTSAAYGWYQIASASQSCGQGTDAVQNQALDAFHAANPNVTIGDFSRLVVIHNCDPSVLWSMQSTLGRRTVSRPYGQFTLSTVWMLDNTALNASVLIHELGHSFGLDHAGLLVCANVSATTVIDPNCLIEGSGDFFSVMGKSGDQGSHHAAHRSLLGWLSETNVKTVVPADMGTSGYLDVALEPIETCASGAACGSSGTPSPGVKAVRIQRGPDDYLTIEYRQPIGGDAGLRTQQDGNPVQPNIFYGALGHVRAYGVSGPKSMLIDFSPPTSYLTPVMPVNGYYIDPVAGFVVIVLSQTPQSLTLRVILHPDTTRPIVTIESPTSQSFQTGNVLVRANATDNYYVTRLEFFRDQEATPFLVRTTSATAWTTFPTVPDGQHTVTVRAYDRTGNVGERTLAFTVDTQKPIAVIESPANGETVQGVATIRLRAEDASGIDRADVVLDNDYNFPIARVGSCGESVCRFTVSWDTSTVATGPHALKVRAFDRAGNPSPFQTDAATSVTVQATKPDSPPPQTRDEP